VTHRNITLKLGLCIGVRPIPGTVISMKKMLFPLLKRTNKLLVPIFCMYHIGNEALELLMSFNIQQHASNI